MRVTHLVPPPSAGEAMLRSHVAALVDGLAGLGVDGRMVERLEAAAYGDARRSVRAARFWAASSRDSGPVWSTALAAAGAIDDVWHVHGFASLPGLLGRGGRFGVVVFSPHYHRARARRRVGLRRLDADGGAVVRLVDAFVCSSHGEARLLARELPRGAERIRVVREGVDVESLQRARPFALAGPVVLVSGRLERIAHVQSTVAAMASLPSEFRMVVLGDGPARRSLKALVAELELSGRVVFCGEVGAAERHGWLRTAAMVVDVSERETFDVALLEALHVGTPVLLSDTPAHRELAALGGAGAVRFVSARCSPLAIADGIVDGARRSSAPAVAASEPFAERFVALYASLLAERATDVGAVGVAVNGFRGEGV